MGSKAPDTTWFSFTQHCVVSPLWVCLHCAGIFLDRGCSATCYMTHICSKSDGACGSEYVCNTLHSLYSILKTKTALLFLTHHKYKRTHGMLFLYCCGTGADRTVYVHYHKPFTPLVRFFKLHDVLVFLVVPILLQHMSSPWVDSKWSGGTACHPDQYSYSRTGVWGSWLVMSPIWPSAGPCTEKHLELGWGSGWRHCAAMGLQVLLCLSLVYQFRGF